LLSLGGDVVVSTRSTLRARARSGGGQVLGCRLPPSPVVVPISTRYPPYEQWLVGLEVGAVSSPAVSHPCSTTYPPCEQWPAAVGMGAGAGLSFMSVGRRALASTLGLGRWALALGVGIGVGWGALGALALGGGVGIGHWALAHWGRSFRCRMSGRVPLSTAVGSSALPYLLFTTLVGWLCCPHHRDVVTWPVAPTIHPASSGLQQWGWVLAGGGWWGVFFVVVRSSTPPFFPPLVVVHLRSVVTWPLAPVNHPVSSGSQAWGWVLGWRSCMAFVRATLPVVAPLSGDVAIAPANHPASSGSQGWGRVLGLVVAVQYAVVVVGSRFVGPRFPPVVWL